VAQGVDPEFKPQYHQKKKKKKKAVGFKSSKLINTIQTRL
jgi:hypothetical protein